MTADHLKSIFNTLIKSKSKEVDSESLRILAQNLNFGFFEKRKFKKAINELQFLEGEDYNQKKNEMITMAEGKLEQLLSRRDFLKKSAMVAAGVAAASVIPGFAKKAFAEESRLSENEVPTLTEVKYWDLMNGSPSCIIMYYNPQITEFDVLLKSKYGATPQQLGDIFMEEMMDVKNRTNSRVQFYRINWGGSSSKLFNKLKKDIQTKRSEPESPSFVAYKNGMIPSAIRGPPTPEQRAYFVKGFMEDFL